MDLHLKVVLGISKDTHTHIYLLYSKGYGITYLLYPLFPSFLDPCRQNNLRPQLTDRLTARSKWHGDASIGPGCFGATVAIAVGWLKIQGIFFYRAIEVSPFKDIYTIVVLPFKKGCEISKSFQLFFHCSKGNVLHWDDLQVPQA